MSIVWSDKLAIGIEVIDHEHKEIVEEFDRLYALMRSGQGHNFYKMLMIFLMDYVDKHLKHEEAFMAQINYDDIEEHKQIHKDFRDKVVDLESRHRVGKITNKDLIDLNLILKDWLIHHISEVDMKVGTFVKANKIDLSQVDIKP